MKDIKLILSGEVRQAIGEHAGRSYPKECCGILFGKEEEAGTFTVKEAAAATGGQERCYSIDPLKLHELEKEYRKKGLEILGFYHSHPDAEALPSERDRKEMLPALAYLIIEIREAVCRSESAWMKDPKYGNTGEIEIIYA